MGGSILLSAVSLPILMVVVLVVYPVSLVVYRLYFHPLAKYPGPKLAAATLWYEFYYDVYKTGSYLWKVKELHEEYGPIIRISPNGIHINDPDFFDVYNGKAGERRDKYEWAVTHFNTPESIVAAINHDLHRSRREAVAAFFSKSNVRKVDFIIRENIQKLLKRFKDFEESGEPLNIAYAFKALTSDIINTYSYGESTGNLEKPDFNAAWWQLFHSFAEMDAFTNHFAWFLPTVRRLPFWIIKAMGQAHLHAFEIRAKRHLQDMIDNEDKSDHASTIVFRNVLNGSLPPEEKSLERLWNDAQTFDVAGTETTSWTLAILVYYMLEQSPDLQRLREELEAAGVGEETSSTELEKLPFLTAVIKEGLRLSQGVSGRLYRISPDKPLIFKDGKREWVIEPGTPVSMTIPLIHLNPQIFPSPYAFQPSRWLNNPKLDRYLVPFSRGPRACVGMNLAWAELYYTAASLFRRYSVAGEEGVPSMRLYQTTVSDVELKHDLFVPAPRLDSKGVRVVFSA